MEITKVRKCEVTECAYNTDNCCHAIAITIGDESNPMCDTFCQSAVKGGDNEATACVGACKVSSCQHNDSLECQCPEIEVGYQGYDADCLSFESAE